MLGFSLVPKVNPNLLTGLLHNRVTDKLTWAIPTGSILETTTYPINYTLQRSFTPCNDDWVDFTTGTDINELDVPCVTISAHPYYRLKVDFVDEYPTQAVSPTGVRLLVSGVPIVVNGAYPTTLYSNIVTPYAELSNKDFLRGKAIIRKEILIAKNNNGNQAVLYKGTSDSTPCTACKDPITGDITNSHCTECKGTGFILETMGEYFPIWITASNHGEALVAAPTGTTDVDNTYRYRTISCPTLTTDDVLLDTRLRKAYTVRSVKSVAEVRRIPLVYQVTVVEEPPNSPLHELGDSFNG